MKRFLQVLALLLATGLAVGLFCAGCLQGYSTDVVEPEGEMSWARLYGGTDLDEAAACVVPTADGGFVVAGNIEDGAGRDAWVLKLRADGKVAWQYRYGGADDESVATVRRTTDGGYVTAGTWTPAGGGDTRAWVVKLTSEGAVSWQRSYGESGRSYQARDIQETEEGYVAAGSGGGDVWVCTLEANGDLDWQRSYGGAADTDDGNAVQVTDDGGFVVVGTTRSTAGNVAKVYVLKLAPNGDVSWQSTYGGTGDDYGLAVRQTSDNGYLVAGTTTSFGAGGSDVWLVKLTDLGWLSWTRAYGTSADEQIASLDQSGSWVLAGWTETGEDRNLWALRLAGSGSIEWQTGFGTAADEAAASVGIIPGGGYVVAGHSEAPGSRDLLVCRLDSRGEISGCGLLAETSATVKLTTTATRAGSVTDYRDEQTYATAAETTVSGTATSVSPREACE